MEYTILLLVPVVILARLWFEAKRANRYEGEVVGLFWNRAAFGPGRACHLQELGLGFHWWSLLFRDIKYETVRRLVAAKWLLPTSDGRYYLSSQAREHYDRSLRQ